MASAPISASILNQRQFYQLWERAGKDVEESEKWLEDHKKDCTLCVKGSTLCIYLEGSTNCTRCTARRVRCSESSAYRIAYIARCTDICLAQIEALAELGWGKRQRRKTEKVTVTATERSGSEAQEDCLDESLPSARMPVADPSTHQNMLVNAATSTDSCLKEFGGDDEAQITMEAAQVTQNGPGSRSPTAGPMWLLTKQESPEAHEPFSDDSESSSDTSDVQYNEVVMQASSSESECHSVCTRVDDAEDVVIVLDDDSSQPEEQPSASKFYLDIMPTLLKKIQELEETVAQLQQRKARMETFLRRERVRMEGLNRTFKDAERRAIAAEGELSQQFKIRDELVARCKEGIEIAEKRAKAAEDEALELKTTFDAKLLKANAEVTEKSTQAVEALKAEMQELQEDHIRRVVQLLTEWQEKQIDGKDDPRAGSCESQVVSSGSREPSENEPETALQQTRPDGELEARPPQVQHVEEQEAANLKPDLQDGETSDEVDSTNQLYGGISVQTLMKHYQTWRLKLIGAAIDLDSASRAIHGPDLKSEAQRISRYIKAVIMTERGPPGGVWVPSLTGSLDLSGTWETLARAGRVPLADERVSESLEFETLPGPTPGGASKKRRLQ